MSNEGINKNFHSQKRKRHSTEEFVDGVLAGNRTLLSEAITLVESSKLEHRKKSEKIIERCLPHSGNSIRIGITGVPGVGKSTFIESFGQHITSMGKKVAVLAIDPSSQKSGGSILGDKTRMESLVNNPNVFIRPTPAKQSLGGVARHTRESIILCEAANFDVILIETVGVGQSETVVRSMVDFFLLLMLAGAGDELQGIKRGIMEMADTIAITKADGDNSRQANRAKGDYTNALHLFPANNNGWIPKVETCSAINNENIDTLWDIINDFQNITQDNNSFENRRKEQAKFWMYETINEELKRTFYENPNLIKKLSQMENKVKKGTISPFSAAHQLLSIKK